VPPDEDDEDDAAIDIMGAENEVVALAIKALVARSRDTFQRAGVLVHVVEQGSTAAVTRPEDQPRIVTMKPGRLQEELGSCSNWNRNGKPISVPAHVVQMVHGRGEWPAIRRLRGIATTPVMRPDGTILDRPGYDAVTQLMYCPSQAYAPVPESPTPEQARQAVERVLDCVCDFPFASEAGRAAWLAACLTPFARHAFEGPVPLCAIDKNVRGAGGSLLADVIGIMATGADQPRCTNAEQEDEMRKRITSIALAGDPLVLLDNIEGKLGGAALNAALTGTTWSDRRLGQNSMVQVPLLAQWFATGNNMQYDPDTLRRTLHVRLNSHEERPEERTGFRHADLRQHVKRHRGELVRDCLIVLRAYSVAGGPDQRLTAWGSYEQWSRLVRDCVVWAGLPDPGLTRQQLAGTGDGIAEALSIILDAIGTQGATGCTTTGILNMAGSEQHPALQDALDRLCPGQPGKPVTAAHLGRRLAQHRDRVVGGAALQSFLNREKITLWTAARVQCS
jgi:hypothetical protein